MNSQNNLLLALALLALAGGCIERNGAAASPCTQVTIAQQIQVNNVESVDLLFMVDNSNSMSEEQASLTAEFPRMISILASGDFNEDGDIEDDEDFDPVRNLNVGVITSDMGTGGFDVPTCARSDFGDDGILRTTGRVDITGCMATYPPFLNFMVGGGQTPTDFANDVACVATTGTGGCGFEQQLEAMLKALSPTASQPWTSTDFVAIGTPGAAESLRRPFFMGTQPHADRENDGFVRDNSVLAIIPVTDEEDCSAHDPEIFNMSSSVYQGDLNLRCFLHGARALHPVDRYVRGLLQLRSRPGLLIYAPITGIPTDLVPESGESPDYAALISPDLAVRDDRMEERVDPSATNRLVPSCNVPGRGTAFPPIRIVGVAQGLQAAGAGVTVQSICQDNFRGALTEIIRQIKSALGAACLPRRLNAEADGRVSCDVVAVLPAGMACQAPAEPKLDDDGNPVMEGGRPVCVLEQYVPTADQRTDRVLPAETGWVYDDYSVEGQENCDENDGAGYQRIAFTGAQPPSGAIVRLECFLAVGGGDGEIAVGSFCNPENPALGADCSAASTPGRELACDPISRSCQVVCDTDAICRSAGLVGYVCDPRTLSEIDEGEFPGNTTPHNMCVNPTCG
jgi:hypothetical protein